MEDTSSVSKYYSDVAARYDELYEFTKEYIAEFAVKHLRLNPDDRLTDIGAGTGAVTSLIWKKSGLKEPVLCVEPSEEMLKVAETRDGIKTCLATADTFLSDHNNLPKYNKVLFNGCAHLFPDTRETFHKAFDYLPKDGVLVLVTRATMCTFPMWKALEDHYTPVNFYGFKLDLASAGFKVSLTVEVGVTKMTKCDWYNKLRRRIFTTLSELSDEEIEDGIKELDREWYPDKKKSDVVEIRDTVGFYTATKQ